MSDIVHIERHAHPLNDYRIRERRFLEAWKQGVLIAGESYFNITAPGVAEATDKNQLRPDWNHIDAHIGYLSRGEAAFLAAMYSFFNSVDGQRLLEGVDFPNICDLAAKLDPDRAEVIAELLMTYPGW